MADHWERGAPAGVIGSCDEAVEETRRCTACGGLFGRPRGSDKTHRQVDDTVGCPEDAEVTTIQKANQWTRR